MDDILLMQESVKGYSKNEQVPRCYLKLDQRES